MKRAIVLHVVLFLLVTLFAVGQIPKRISYQGVLTTSGGAPAADGSYDILFNLYDIQSGGPAIFTETHYSVAVSRGTFKVVLGSVTTLNLPFDRTYYLEMTVNAGPGITEAVVFPRSEFTSSPYSLRADTSAYATRAVPTGTAGGDLTGSYPNPTIANSAITLSKINTSGAVSGQALMFNGSSAVWNTPAGSGGSFSLPFADTVAADTFAFMIMNTGPGFTGAFAATNPDGYYPAVFGSSAGHGVAVHGQNSSGGDGVNGVATGASGSGGAFSIDNADNSGNALRVSTLGSGNGVDVNTWLSGDAIHGQVNSSGTGAAIHGVNLGLGGGGKFTIQNSMNNNSNALEGETDGGGIAIKGYQSGTGHGGWFEINNASNNYPSLFTRTNGNGNSFFSYHNGSARAGLFTVDNPGNSNPAIEVSTTGSGYAGFFSGASKGVYISANTAINNPHLALMENESDYSRLSFQNKNTANYWTIAAQPNNDSKMARLNFYYSPSGDFMTVTGDGNVGIGTGSPTSKLTVAGKAEMNVIQINGGSDLAEPFDVENMNEAIEPGTLMSIDEENPGKLKITSAEYDTRIAGVVSGAGGIKPGITLQQDGIASGNTMVAIAGRVYCKADASGGEINPGDLLTSSDFPGYAMKASDRDRSQGAIIGKAMSSLKDGKGLVLVLVNLQ